MLQHHIHGKQPVLQWPQPLKRQPTANCAEQESVRMVQAGIETDDDRAGINPVSRASTEE
jgi:hypothetical protein